MHGVESRFFMVHPLMLDNGTETTPLVCSILV
ncbi:hypothetical protein FHW16_005583 [Phyllobacterium myrsinacearum]|uniref:Uncharacterized protein n=1 Tax=Phyllobacterium myrsinacearum TaxID=28101 RepID=A0A839EX10_9HYPH|nr:hypothetical protein [Phyllobacterium myrsinacearum]